MIKTFFIGVVILFIAVVLMGIKVFFSKRGKFSNTHIGASDAMKSRGISCATSQDRMAFEKESPIEKLLTKKI